MLNKEDLLVISMHNECTPTHYSILSLLYKPLMNEQAYQLYLTLVAMKQQNLNITNHVLLQRTTKLSIEAIEHARGVCEQFLLLRSYYNEQEKTYLYEIGLPMSMSNFLAHDVFGRYFQKVMGSDIVSFYKKEEKHIDKTNYKEQSLHIKNLIEDIWDETDEKTFVDTQDEFNKTTMNELHVIFDEKEFLSKLGEIVLPSNQRTPKLLRHIAEIATIYGINEVMMRKLLSKAWDDDNQRVDIEKLKDICFKTTAKYSSNFKDPYMLPTIRFLENKQNGVKLGYADKMLAIKLVEEYRLQPEVANVIFETCLAMNSQKIIGTVIERLASSWLRLKIDNLETAKKQMGIEVNSFQSNKFGKGQNIIVQEWKQEIETTIDEDSEDLLEKFNKLKEEYDATSNI